MSFDIPQIHISDNSPEAQVLESIIRREKITPEEIVRRALRSLAPEPPKRRRPATRKGKGGVVAPITDEELAHLDRICPALKLLDDVTDEEWDNVLAGARKMNREGFANRA